MYSSGQCGVWEQIKYWNLIIDTNIEDLATKQINTWESPILNGGTIQSTRFSQKEIQFTIDIKSKDKKSLEKEIRDIKRNLNYKWTKIIKKEKTRVSEINVELQDVEIGKISVKSTELTLSFISLDPNFKKPSWNTKAYRNIAWNLDVSLIINDTDIPPFIHTLIDIKQLTGTITKVQLELDGYQVEIDGNIENPEKIIFDGKTSNIYVGSTQLEDFKWKFVPFTINTPRPIKVTFIGWTVQEYSIYFTYDNIYL